MVIKVTRWTTTAPSTGVGENRKHYFNEMHSKSLPAKGWCILNGVIWGFLFVKALNRN